MWGAELGFLPRTPMRSFFGGDCIVGLCGGMERLEIYKIKCPIFWNCFPAVIGHGVDVVIKVPIILCGYGNIPEEPKIPNKKALQGAFTEHINLLNRLKNDVSEAIQIKTKDQLLDPSLDALILPGGESTTMALVAERSGLMEPLRDWVKHGRPVWVSLRGGRFSF